MGVQAGWLLIHKCFATTLCTTVSKSLLKEGLFQTNSLKHLIPGVMAMFALHRAMVLARYYLVCQIRYKSNDAHDGDGDGDDNDGIVLKSHRC